jgi:hypothetical protein
MNGKNERKFKIELFNQFPIADLVIDGSYINFVTDSGYSHSVKIPDQGSDIVLFEQNPKYRILDGGRTKFRVEVSVIPSTAVNATGAVSQSSNGTKLSIPANKSQ